MVPHEILGIFYNDFQSSYLQLFEINYTQSKSQLLKVDFQPVLI